MAATAAPPRHARPEPTLPPGPEHGVLAQTVALHRDPLGTLREAVDRYGRMVLRATILVPHRSTPVVARNR